MAARQTPHGFPQIPLLSLDLEQRKSPAGIYPLPAPQVVHLQSQSGGLDRPHTVM